ncbi:Centrosomal protein of 83 kDa [Takifugu flavidus]|uniref:Centrosomal protein of 83 kDa n=1 Tax=Takifugu flavidus TaxID=433684 RepID=A0A5C6NER4_9TELE|nr:Centrosomal protein of 83 kDa [Takifugu flavidus]
MLILILALTFMMSSQPPQILHHGTRTEWTSLTGHFRLREQELQKVLNEERHNYRTLKELTTRLQDEFLQAQNEIRHLLSDKQTLQHQMKLQAADFQKSLLAKSKRLEELQQQTMSPLQQEMLKAQMQQEMDAPVREMRLQLEEEIEKYKAEYYKLRYECLRLQSQADQQREEHARALESQRLRYQAEMSCLQTDKEALAARLQSSDQRSNDKKLEALMKERVQLKVRIQGLEAEVAELLAQRETKRQQADNVAKVLNKQLTDSQELARSLGTKLESARQQLETKQKELQLSCEENSRLCKQLHGAGRQITTITCQAEEANFAFFSFQMETLKSSHKQDVNSLQLEFMLSQQELEKEKEAYKGQTEVLRTEVELLRAEITQLREVLMEKEEEMCRKVHWVHEEGLHKAAQVQKERLELEKHMTQTDAAVKDQLGKWLECLNQAKHREESMSKELKDLRTELQQQRSQILEHQSHKVQMGELQQRNNKLEEELRSVSNSQEQLRETNKQLQGSLERVREELRTTQVQAERSQQEAERSQQEAERSQQEAERLLQHSQNQSLEEKRKLQQKYAEAKEKMQRAAAAQKKFELMRRKTMTEHKEKKLRNKIELLEAKTEELQLEVSFVKKNLSDCEKMYEMKTKTLLRARKDFESVLFGDPRSSDVRILASYTAPFASAAELRSKDSDALSNIRLTLHELN